MPFCSSCGRECAAEDRFCPHCGAPQEPSGDPVVQLRPPAKAPAKPYPAAPAAAPIEGRRPRTPSKTAIAAIGAVGAVILAAAATAIILLASPATSAAQCMTPIAQPPSPTSAPAAPPAGGASSSVTIYTSLTGGSGDAQGAGDVLSAEQLALQQAGGHAGDVSVNLAPLGDQSASAGGSDPGQTAANARQAAQDPDARGYIGEFGSSESAIAIPILNQAGIVEVSPSNTYLGLTRAAPSDGPGEPTKYYPTGTRTYARVIPNDAAEARAAVAYMVACRVKSVYVVSDEPAGETGLASGVAADARQAGIRVSATSSFREADPHALADQVARSRASAMFFSGSSASDALALWANIHAADPAMKLFASHGLATPEFAGSTGSAQAETYLTSPELAPSCYPPAGRAFLASFVRTYGHQPGQYAIFGYLAMQRILAAVAASDGSKEGVLQALFHAGDQPSAIGTFSIDPNGDTTLSTYGGWKIVNHRLGFDRALDANGNRTSSC